MADTASRYAILRTVAKEFSSAFVSGSTPPSELLAEYFVAEDPRIIEHGPEWAQKRLPFVGRLFRGRRSSTLTTNGANTAPSNTATCDDYFDLLGATVALHAHADTLPENNAYVVDPNSLHSPDHGPGAVLVKCHAALSSVHTKRTWEEHFVFVLSGFDAGGKIGQLEIWADNLNAWAAVGGEDL
ncbi:hypothetical protein MPH_03162 [Macrophomina phaseolina MS6]|uniref:Uncharacterized protein n=1 Tax=Macrophomina phaseolina (strain MS6) TaxID=1126212 RepID=K2SA56_MACPH|nr:hypothetical protein MPH_03162 [Macrophomina phaseolina MS6]